jgi:flagellar biosynthesis/type III secretory pathway protein FliH
MTLALMSSSAVYGLAQTTYDGQPVAKVAFFEEHEHSWEEGQRRAREMGYQDGLSDGRHDFDHHRGFRMERNGAYRNADHGYERRFGDKVRYQEEYRHAYERGYREGFHQEEHH